MIIDVNGNKFQAWYRADGPLIKDSASDNPYHIDFGIAIRYSDEQKQAFLDISLAKKFLKSTDYKAIKYAEGVLTEEEYAPIKEQRAQARARINELIFPEPTLTRAEMDEAERKAMQKKGER